MRTEVNLSPSIVSSHIGFAIATIKAFTNKPGVSGEQIKEALERLEEALAIIQEYERL